MIPDKYAFRRKDFSEVSAARITSTLGPDFEAALSRRGPYFIARRAPRSSSFDEWPMSRGRPQRGATFSIHKVERRDDENSEGTGADPESTDPLCSSVVDLAVLFRLRRKQRETIDIVSRCVDRVVRDVCSDVVCRFNFVSDLRQLIRGDMSGHVWRVPRSRCRPNLEISVHRTT